MRRKIQIKGYTRTVKGKTVKVRPYSRMVGKDSPTAGAELSARKAEREPEKEKPKKYNEDINAVTPSGLTVAESRKQAMLTKAIFDYNRAPKWQKERMLADPYTGPILKEYLKPAPTKKAKGKFRQRVSEKLDKLQAANRKYANEEGFAGAINRFAVGLHDYAERSRSKKKR